MDDYAPDFEFENEDNSAIDDVFEDVSESLTPNRTSKYVYGKDRKSRPIMTRFEKVRLISARAEAIAKGSPPAIETDETDYIKIAEMELMKKVIPLTLYRPYGDTIEVWEPEELMIKDR